MGADFQPRELERLEILSLVDNFIDLTSMDSNEMVQRALPVKDMKIKGNVLAEHGYSALVRTEAEGESHLLLFDFGYSETAVPYNLERLGVDLGGIEAAVLSHGHRDHTGAFYQLMEMIDNKPLPLYLHPDAFLKQRYLKYGDIKVFFPELDREKMEKAGADVREQPTPTLLAGGTALFLGEIARETEFEKGMPNAYFADGEQERWDPVRDDTSLVFLVKGKGLVVLSGCAHSGIVNTVRQAQRLTGVEKVHAVMGGFHLSGPAFAGIIPHTIEELKKINPDFLIPAHCTGHRATVEMERAFPKKFILNMSGTRIIFTGS
ncbi:MAG: MBL fold metallo-hydrolase [Candidatus Geothermincolales bacterium]